jgi:cell division protein FtsB
MIHKRRQKNINGFISKPTTLSVLALLIIIAISIPLFKNIKKQYEINKEISSLEQEIKNFENQNSELKKTFEYLESDQFVSEQARKNLNYKKEGEEVVVIKTIDKQNTTKDKKDFSQEFNNTPASNPILWWRYFFY